MLDPQLRKAILATVTAAVTVTVLMTIAFPFADENELGAEVYTKKCVMCHGKDGVGDTKAGAMMKTPNITVVEWKNGKTVADLVKTLHEGLGKMPKYEGKLSEEELAAVAEYTVAKFVK